MKFSVMNLGCKVNAYETESIASMMEKMGYQRSDLKDDRSDVCMIFTCAVTNTAAQKSRQMIHKVKRNNPDCTLVVAGCYAQIDPEALQEADILVGSSRKLEIPKFVEQFHQERKRIEVIGDQGNMAFEPLLINRFENQTRAILKVQDGCNQFCSFCVIPFARGRERSMDPNIVIAEAQRLSQHHSEIVLAGIHTGRYGKEYGVTLAELLSRILAEAPFVQRLRISSIEVTEITDEFIELLKSNDRIARHLHIPLQSGCDAVLKRMNRPYTTKQYLEVVERIRKEVPDICISADLIVGFPQETEAEFQETCAFLETAKLSFLHVFPFSVRSGTKAAEMPCHVESQIKKERANICIKISENQYDSYKDSWIGRKVTVLSEGYKDGYTTGHASQYFLVKIKGEYKRGTMVDVIITKRLKHELFGEVQ